MDDDLKVDFTRVYDEATPQRDNTYLRSKTYVFWIGKFGPYTERVPLEPFDPTEIGRRVDALRMHLRTLPA